MDFLYTGEVEVEQADLASFLALGAKLAVKGLAVKQEEGESREEESEYVPHAEVKVKSENYEEIKFDPLESRKSGTIYQYFKGDENVVNCNLCDATIHLGQVKGKRKMRVHLKRHHKHLVVNPNCFKQRKKWSPLWEFFQPDPVKRFLVKCQLCSASVTRGSEGSSDLYNHNMKNHVKKFHPTHWRKIRFGHGQNVDLDTTPEEIKEEKEAVKKETSDEEKEENSSTATMEEENIPPAAMSTGGISVKSAALVKSRLNKSPLWNFFSSGDEDRREVVGCNRCGGQVRRGRDGAGSQDLGNKGMWLHLKKNHPEDFSVYQEFKLAQKPESMEDKEKAEYKKVTVPKIKKSISKAVWQYFDEVPVEGGGVELAECQVGDCDVTLAAEEDTLTQHLVTHGYMPK